MSEHLPSAEAQRPHPSLQALYDSCFGEVLTQLHMARAQHAQGRLYVEEDTMGRLVTVVTAEAAVRQDPALADRALEDFDTFPDVYMDTWTRAYFLGLSARSERAHATLSHRLAEEKDIRAAELASRNPFLEYANGLSPLANDDSILTGIVMMCRERSVPPDLWIHQGTPNEEERWRYQAAYYMDELVAEHEDGTEFHQGRFEQLAQELLERDFDEGFVFGHIGWIVRHSKNPAVRLQAMERFGELAAVAPCAPQTCKELLRVARTIAASSEPVSAATMERLEATIADWTATLQPFVEDTTYYELMNAKLAWERARRLRHDGDIDAAIAAVHTDTSKLAEEFQARDGAAEGPNSFLLEDLQRTRYKEMADWALAYVTRGDPTAARKCMSAIDDGDVRAYALRQCLQHARTFEDVAALRPDPMDMAVYPGLLVAMAVAESRFTRDVDRLHALGLQAAHNIVNTVQISDAGEAAATREREYGDLRQLYEAAMQIDASQELPLAEALFAITRHAPDPYGDSDFLLMPLWRSGNVEALQYAYAQLEYAPDPDMRIGDLVHLMRRLSTALGRT